MTTLTLNSVRYDMDEFGHVHTIWDTIIAGVVLLGVAWAIWYQTQKDKES